MWNTGSNVTDILNRQPCFLAWSWKWNTVRLNASSAWRVPHSISKAVRRSSCEHWACTELQGCTTFPKIYKAPQTYRRQEGHTKKVPYWGTINIRRTSTNPGAQDQCTPAKLYEWLAFRSYHLCFTCVVWMWNLVPKSDYTFLRITDNKAQRKIFGPKITPVTGNWQTLFERSFLSDSFIKADYVLYETLTIKILKNARIFPAGCTRVMYMILAAHVVIQSQVACATSLRDFNIESRSNLSVKKSTSCCKTADLLFDTTRTCFLW